MRIWTAGALALGAAAWTAGCTSVGGFTSDVKGLFSKKEDTTLSGVDRLVGQIEAVHLAAEVAQARAGEALQRLEALASPEFVGDPLVAYREYVDAVEVSEEATEELARSMAPAQKSADAVFAAWRADLDVFTVPELRQRSQKRLDETRARYEKAMTASQDAHVALTAFDTGLRDHALFLGHDFNAASIAAIQRELGVLSGWSKEVDRRLDACLQATAEYVKASALPGTIEVAPKADAGTR